MKVCGGVSKDETGSGNIRNPKCKAGSAVVERYQSGPGVFFESCLSLGHQGH